MKMDKAFLRLEGKTFLQRAIECTFGLFRSVYIVGKTYQDPRIKGCILDDLEGIGPIGGIYTALRKTDRENNFFIGVDYPLASPEIFLSLARFLGPGFLGLIPVTPDGPHPLFAFYSRQCLTSIESCIEKGRYDIRCMADTSPILFLDLAAHIGTEAFERLKKNFININSARDYHDLLKGMRNRKKFEKKI